MHDKIKSARETDMGAVVIIDSMMMRPDALKQNPANPCPQEILAIQMLITARHIGFDDRLHEGQIVIDSRHEADVRSFLELAQSLNFPIEKLAPAVQYAWDDELLMDQNVSSGFNYRTIAGTNTVSMHGLGMAFDINPRLNPYIRYENGATIIAPKGANYDPKINGTLFTKHPLVVHMKSLGWQWGGDWPATSGRTDYQHFEKSLKSV